LEHGIRKALRGIKGPAATRGALRVIQQPLNGGVGWNLTNVGFIQGHRPPIQGTHVHNFS
jgi:hypothetical protein